MMAMFSVRCPKCRNVCEFKEGRLFGFCNKCGTALERDIDNHISIYDRSKETDEQMLFVFDRFDACSAIKLPSRADHDFESFNYEVERIMDELMTFAECMKDTYTAMQSMDKGQQFRVCSQCADMSDRLFKQFEGFLNEYRDYGMYDKLKSVKDVYADLDAKMSSEFSSIQKQSAASCWAGREEEYAELKRKLEDAKMRKTQIPFYNLQANWEADNEIAELEAKLSGNQ